MWEAKKNKVEIIQDKIITFNLSEVNTIKSIMNNDHAQRHEAEALFEELERAGLGEYVRGRTGRNGAAKFIKNEQCPNQYTMIFKMHSLQKKFIQEEIKPILKVISLKAAEIFKIKRTPKRVPDNYGRGCVCSVAQGYLFLDRIQGGGFDTVEKAVDDVWIDIKDIVPAKGTKCMTPKEEVESILKGIGYYKLGL